MLASGQRYVAATSDHHVAVARSTEWTAYTVFRGGWDDQQRKKPLEWSQSPRTMALLVNQQFPRQTR